MEAQGDFSVELVPANDDDYPAGRLLMDKIYSGDLQGTGRGQMISHRVESGESAYAAIEHIQCELEGQRGSFTLLHTGSMSDEHRHLEIDIVEGSGQGALTGIAGAMQVEIDDLGHHYLLSYALPAL